MRSATADLTPRVKQGHLHLEPLSVDQITRIEDIPIRPVELEPIDSNATLGGYAGNAAPVVR